MANELLTILEYIEQERGISRDSLIKALESAILTAARKSIHPASELKVKIDPVTGQIQAWATLEVVEENPTCDQLVIARARERFPDVQLGEKVEWEVTPRNFGRPPGDRAAAPQGGKRERAGGIRRPDRPDHQRNRPPLRSGQHHHRLPESRGDHAFQGENPR